MAPMMWHSPGATMMKVTPISEKGESLMRYPNIRLGVICLSVTSLYACAPHSEQRAGPVVDESKSIEADVGAIKRVNADLIVAFHNGDANAAVALVMDDAVDLPPNRPAVIGKEAIQSSVQSDFDQFTWNFTDQIVEVQVDGDLAVVWTNYMVTLTPKHGGEQIERSGKWLKVLKRQTDGSWKFSRNIWNSHNPPTKPPTS